MKFIVIVIDEDYTSLKRKIENETQDYRSVKIRQKWKKPVTNNSESNWPHQNILPLPPPQLSVEGQKLTQTHKNKK